MESYEDKVARVARAMWCGFGGRVEHFGNNQSYIDGAKAVITEADRDDVPTDEAYEAKVKRAINALATVWERNRTRTRNRHDALHMRGVKAALEEEARDIEEAPEVAL